MATIDSTNVQDNCQENNDNDNSNNKTESSKVDIMPGKMKKINLKPSASPTSFLAKSSLLLPTGVAQVKQLPNIPSPKSMENKSNTMAMGSSCSATGNPRNKTALAPGHSLMDWIRLGSSNVDLTGVGGVHQVVTLTELAKHNKRNDAWLAVRGIVFNVTRYMDFHPGGVEELMRGVGKDATKLFEDVHAWVNYQSILQKCIVGRLCRSGKTETSDNPFNSDEKLTEKLSSLKTVGKNSESPKIFSDWKQTTNTITFIYKSTDDKFFPNYQLIRENDNEFKIKINQTNGIINHEYDLIEGVNWPPKWKKNYDTMEIDFCFTKLTGKIWNFYGNRTIGSQIKSTERNYRQWQIVCNTILCDNINHLVLKSKDYMEIMRIGRHVEVKMDVMGTEVSRYYTPVPSSIHPDDEAPGYKPDCLCLIVKRYNDGALSPSITALQQGQYVTLSNELGTFAIESFDQCSIIHLLSAGTGLTPMLGIIQWALCRRNITTINLINFNRNEKNIFYQQQLDKISADKRLNVVHVLSESNDDSWTGRRGKVSDVLLNELIGRAIKHSCIFTCGPIAFMTIAREALVKLGWTTSQLHEFDG
ncbi:hypothetical protein PV326_010945 [Microctonus aethiopoides]|nr:hypothetical protein PV326_010945 [Microctonus aethiopoides]